VTGRGELGARILDGRVIAAAMLAETRTVMDRITGSRGRAPEIRVVLVGNDAASAVYARRILRAAEDVGSRGELVQLAADASVDAVRGALEDCSGDPSVTGVILQLPLPAGLPIADVIVGLDPAKDLDGIHPLNAGLISRRMGGFAPSCAEAALQILKRSDIDLAGRSAVVVGRSNVVGRPAGLLLTAEDATVTVCHRRTRDLENQVRAAEVVVVAAGSPGLIRGDFVRPGAVIVDCGINVLENGSIVGDVDPSSVLPVAGAMTPVPGGVGPVTNAVLMEHLARTAAAQAGDPRLLDPVLAG
jgi:methylenetetrahydrofolate dehydrogenase (NADP+)/methenyltetrahydrofolate cyclohydrolase